MKLTVKNLLKKLSAVSITLCMLSSGILTVGASAGAAEDDLTGLQWHFHKKEHEQGVIFPSWNDASKTNIDVAKNAVIAVVDSGIDYTHEDLDNIMWKRSESSASAKLAELGFGEYGININEEGSEPMDPSGHGTHVAGIIAAEWNGIGVSGALNGVKLMAVRANRNVNTVYKGFQKVLEAKKAGVNIVAVNLSWNGPTTSSYPELLDGVITELGEAGVVTVMAAGNEGKNLDDEVVLSSFLRTNPYVITVSAGDRDGNLAYDEEGLRLSSNYSVRYCDVAAPGVEILSTFPKTSDEEEYLDPDDIKTISTGSRYVKQDGTSMATPIVTALAALVYNRNSTVDAGGKVSVALAADEIAARAIETAAQNESLETKVYGGLISRAPEGETKPVPFYGRVKSGSLTIWGTDFGSAAGTVTVDGKSAGVTSWGNGSITVSAGSLALGDHKVVITRPDKKSASRWINVSGSTDKITELSTEGLEGNSMFRMVTTGGVLYVYAQDFRSGVLKDVLYSRAPGGTVWKPVSGFDAYLTDLDAAGGRLYLLSTLSDGNVTVFNPSSGTIEQSIPLKTRVDMTWKIRYVGDRIFTVYVVNDSSQMAAHIASVNNDGSLTETAVVEGIDNVLDFFQNNGEKYLVGANRGEKDETICVYKINEASKTGTKVFEKKFTSSDYSLKAYGYQDRLVIAPIVTKNSEGSYSFAMEEYDYGSGKRLQNVILGGGHLQGAGYTGYEFHGAIAEGMFYTAFLSDSLRHNTGALMVPLNGYTPPTPAPTPTPKPAPAPGGGSSDPAVTPASGVQTCQDVGYPEGWYWDEAQKACVAPQGSDTGRKKREYSGTVTPGKIPGSGGDQEAGKTDTKTADPNASPEADESASPETDQTPESEVTPTPTATATPAPLPIDIVNPKSLMWFLGIPIVMIISGLAVYLLHETKWIPWIIGADALATIILAVLDHSLVGWILLVLNLAAVGLMALYRMGEKNSSDY